MNEKMIPQSNWKMRFRIAQKLGIDSEGVGSSFESFTSQGIQKIFQYIKRKETMFKVRNDLFEEEEDISTREMIGEIGQELKLKEKGEVKDHSHDYDKVGAYFKKNGLRAIFKEVF